MGHAVVLFLSLGDMARRDSGRDGGVDACMFQEMSAEISLGSSMGVKAAGWSEGILSLFLAVVSQGETAAWNRIDERRLTCFVVQSK